MYNNYSHIKNYRKRQAKVQKDLEDAAKDTRAISPDRMSLKEGIIGIPSSVPTNVAVKFVRKHSKP